MMPSLQGIADPTLVLDSLVRSPVLAQAGGGDFTSSLTQMAPFLAVFAIIYFLILRPQQQEQKQHEELLASLKKGDEVVTKSGMHGRIHEVQGELLIVEVADRVRITFDRAAVSRKGGDAAAAKE